MIEETQVDEMISCFDDLYEIKDQTRDIVKGAREQVKARKIALKDWAERNKLEYKDVYNVYREYEKFKDGESNWGEETNDDFSAILIMVMDKVKSDKVKTE